MLAPESGTRPEAEQQHTLRGDALRMRQQQRIAELCGEIACRMQTRDEASELGIEVSGGRTELSVLVDADHGAAGRSARLGIDDHLEFHIPGSVIG